MRKNGIIMIAAFAAFCFAGGTSYTMENVADTSAFFVSGVEYPEFRDYPELSKMIIHKVKDGYAALKNSTPPTGKAWTAYAIAMAIRR